MKTPITSRQFAQDRSEITSEAIWSSLLHQVYITLDHEKEIITKAYKDINHYSTTAYFLVIVPHNVVFHKKTLQVVTSRVKYTTFNTVAN